MNAEEKAVFECMNDEINVFEGAYEELEDDFINMLNDGKPALQFVDPAPPKPKEEEKEEEGNNDGPVGFFEENMLPDYKERMADVIAMLDK